MNIKTGMLSPKRLEVLTDKPGSILNPKFIVSNGFVEKKEFPIRYCGKNGSTLLFKGPQCECCGGSIGTLGAYEGSLAFICIGLSCLRKMPRN